MGLKFIPSTAVCAFALLASTTAIAETYPLRQGLHQWNAAGGKLMLVVGTYQDSTSYRRNYAFYFKETNDDAWNQVVIADKSGRQRVSWDSAVGGDVTLADGVVVTRPDAAYFVVADKRADKGYRDKGDISVTWYKLAEADDSRPDNPAYLLKPVFTRSYPQSVMTIDAVLARENSLQPRQ